MRKLSRLTGAALFVALALYQSSAHAAVTGNIAGTVTDTATGKPLAGVTVTATSPALQGEQTEFTDGEGRYIITELPPGEYAVTFYFSNAKVQRSGVFLFADTTLPVNATITTGQVTKVIIVEKAPNVDVGNTQVQTLVTNELVRNTPVQGRTFGSVLTLAPGASRDTGDRSSFSFNGATGPENNFLIDGMNTTNPSYGLLGTPLSLEFIAETEIITGGYNAEYGRATGGVVNVVTKSGSNEFHGGAWFFYQPLQLNPTPVARTGEAIARQSKVDHAFDFGFDLGGPIVKDRIWFYAGVHPQFETDSDVRIIRSRTSNDANSTNAPMGNTPYFGDIDKSLSCPAYLTSQNLCPAPSAATGPFKTRDLDPKYWKSYSSDSRLYNYIGKLTFALNSNNSLTLQYIGSPSSFDGVRVNPYDPNPQTAGNGFNGSAAGIPFTENVQTHDVAAHFTSKMLDRKLQADVLVGYHRESYEIGAGPQGDTVQVLDNRPSSLSRYENLPDCAPTTVGGGAPFNPCPVQGYADGGKGLLQTLLNERWSAQGGLTYFLKLAGTHAIKIGGDFEDNTYTDTRRYTGQSDNGVVTINGDNSLSRFQFATLNSSLPPPGIQVLPNGLTASTSTLNYSLYLRDSWNVGFLPGLTINAGLRWEAEQVRDVNGATQIGIYDNIAPRVGFVYDWTQTGRSKIYASFGRFYESIPADINDRSFSGEGFVTRPTLPPTANGGIDPSCMPDANGRINGAACQFPASTKAYGGTYAQVAPSIQGQYSNEVVAGLQYDVGLDLVLGVAYIHRDLGRIIEDFSPDGGVNYLIGNPGTVADPGTITGLQNQISSLNKQISDPKTDPKMVTTLNKQLTDKQTQLSVYSAQGLFEKPKRDYNAVVLTANKRMSHHFIVLASYTYSRTLGNYPGLFQASNGQIDPNISTQYDLRELLVNRDGPLPDDRPHNIKLTGAYEIPLGDGGITLGGSFNGISGRPIEVIGANPYGSQETFILPRGSGGRTPFITSFDLHVAYARQFSKSLRLDITWDTFNVFNQQAVLEVDDTYSFDNVSPIKNGTVADLRNLRNFNGLQPNLNPNYGQATAYQAPLSMRFGVRVSF